MACVSLNARHFPIFVFIAFSAFAQPTLISFSCSLRHPSSLPPPGEIPGHSRATSDLQYDRGSAALAVRVDPGRTTTLSESNAADTNNVWPLRTPIFAEATE